MSRERDLPPLIDFDDAVDNIERSVDSADDSDDPSVGADVSDHLEELRADLDRLEERDEGSREGILDDIGNTVLSLRADLDEGSEADRYAEGIQNRIQQYRANREAGSGTLTLSRAALEINDAPVNVAQQAGETVALRGTLVNGGERADALAVLTFYDENGRVLRTVESYHHGVDGDEQRDIDTTVYVPETAAYYAVRAVDADDSRTIAGDEPAPDELDREEAAGAEGGSETDAASDSGSDADSEPATDAWDEDDDDRPASERSAEEITDGGN